MGIRPNFQKCRETRYSVMVITIDEDELFRREELDVDTAECLEEERLLERMECNSFKTGEETTRSSSTAVDVFAETVTFLLMEVCLRKEECWGKVR